MKTSLKIQLILLGLILPGIAEAMTPAQLAGNSLAEYPFFEYVKAFNVDATVEVAIDPTRFPGVVGLTCDIYIVESKTITEWLTDPSLTDITAGGYQTESFGSDTIQANTFRVTAPSELSADAGIGLGVGYDVIIDCNRNGVLDMGDYIDGYSEDEAGLYVVHDVTRSGPLAVTTLAPYSVGSIFGIPVGYTNEVAFYPASISSMGKLPMVVISHGNGHNYLWYDHIGNHLASYGYIVMSHQNNTPPGIETASSTTLAHTDAFIDQQSTIGGGVLNGHIDSNRIVWIGHSRGGEGVVRAYHKIYASSYAPTHYVKEDIKLISSMLPTNYLGSDNSNPHNVNYHLWTASGDADVSGTAQRDDRQTFQLHDRATNYRHSTIVQGTGHAWFHNGGGTSWFTGPCSIGETNTHLIQFGMFLPLIKYYTEGNIPASDFFWRQYERFKPIGVPSGDPCIVVTNTYHNGAIGGNFVIDDYQTETSDSVSSSGGAVTYTVEPDFSFLILIIKQSICK
ncbi:MAG: hypothetical protein A2161_09565 [Candidatus Schekmanbacteria bacterium RBG_13_48_7]|uniref:PET hydrolase/cutinase-like domain-containing protein n=1 Tax=Candidatus Schekmanbacteria bacterium RBG_13_48_7 TaxID=1817878 RepID=A0A1F7RXE6_9BACT|nr:MAG: hypothetical protein A2161_09565 [Candidatus Schekmanbacteria bacterium RBG_13_48_7]